MNSEPDELYRLRRFALAVGTIVLAYALAGVAVDSEGRASPLGVPLMIERPDLLPWSLLLVSCYASWRYFYYAFMVGVPPYRARLNLLDAARIHSTFTTQGTALKSVAPATLKRLFWIGTIFFTTEEDHEHAFLASEVRRLFPRVVGGVPGVVARDLSPRDEQGRPVFYEGRVDLRLSRRVQLFAWLQDFDYALPLVVTGIGWLVVVVNELLTRGAG